MLFYDKLDSIIFNRNQMFRCDELLIISGYVGPKPVISLGDLPLKTTVVYGMYGSDGIQKGIHESLVSIDKDFDNIEIKYSTIPVHSKCYLWKNKGDVVYALIGSANFSTNGISTPFKEVLAETTADTFCALNDYSEKVLTHTIPCSDAIVKNNKTRNEQEDNETYDPDICIMPLYILKDGREIIPDKSGINWGMAQLSGSHVNINDAYIKISMDLVEKYPTLFPAKQNEPQNLENVVRIDHRHNDSIDIIWDDGTTMTALLEGSVPKLENGIRVLYPKQISSTPSKAILGKYLRNRLGVPEGKAITLEDLETYGRKTIDVSLQGEGIYFFDFSSNKTGEVYDNDVTTIQTIRVAEDEEIE